MPLTANPSTREYPSPTIGAALRSGLRYVGVGVDTAGAALRRIALPVAGLVLVMGVPRALYRDLIINDDPFPFFFTLLAGSYMAVIAAVRLLPPRLALAATVILLLVTGLQSALDPDSYFMGFYAVYACALLAYWTFSWRYSVGTLLIGLLVFAAIHSQFVEPLNANDILMMVFTAAFVLPHIAACGGLIAAAETTRANVDSLEKRVELRSSSELRTLALLARELRSKLTTVALVTDPANPVFVSEEETRLSIEQLEAVVAQLELFIGGSDTHQGLSGDTNLDALLAEVIWAVEPSYRAAGVILSASRRRPSPRECHIDNLRLRLILLAILRGALRIDTVMAVEVGAAVTPPSELTSQHLRVTITASGTAMTPEDLEALLDAEIHQSMSASDVWQELTTARRLLQKMGGQLTFDSVTEQSGRLQLNLTVTVALIDPTVPTDNAPSKSPEPLLKNQRVLVVEDDGITRRATSVLLTQGFGAKVDDVPSVAEALLALSRGAYTLIVSDFMMVGGDGGDLLEALKARDDTTPVLIVTSSAVSTDMSRLQMLGALAVLAKPLKKIELENILISHRGRLGIDAGADHHG